MPGTPDEFRFVRRFLRLTGERDSLDVSRLTGRLVLDPNLRGWAAVVPALDESTWRVVGHALERSRVLVVRGSKATAFVGDLFALFAAGRELSALERVPVRDLGRWIAGSAEAIDGRPPALVLGSRTFDWSRPVVMGIVNVTPDSFADGGRFLDPTTAIEHGLKLVAEGADLLDIGGESTRPKGAAYGAGATTISDDDELARVLPVIRGLKAKTDVPLSIDTRKPAVAKAAVDSGASLVNDVSGLLHDASLADVCASTGAALCVMHVARDIEALSHEEPSDDVLGDVLTGLQRALDEAERRGIPTERVLIDPGLGFGKSKVANLQLLRHVGSLAAFGRPVLVGASRKATVGAAAVGWWGEAESSVLPVDRRAAGSVGAALAAVANGAHVVRVHDVEATVQALRVWHATRVAEEATDP